MNDVQLSPSGLTDVLTQIFQAAGGSAAEAHRIAANLVEANLAGHDSHGVVRTQRYCIWVTEGIVQFGQSVSTVVDAPAFALLEGNKGFGQTLGEQAVEIGLDKARDQGVSVIGLRNAGHLGRIGAWAEQACRAGFVSIHFVNAYHSRLVAPFGGADRRMGTNPVAIGMPNPGDDHADHKGDFILDFATSTVAEGKVLVAKRGGKPLPQGALVGADGQLTTDPTALYGPVPDGQAPDPRNGPGAITAMGLHKGSGLSLACELLAGALTGSGTCAPGFEFHNGMLSVYIDPERFDDGHGWAAEATAYVDYVRSCKPMDTASPVLTPGDPERLRNQERAQAMPLSGPAWTSILDAATGVGLDATQLSAKALI